MRLVDHFTSGARVDLAPAARRPLHESSRVEGTEVPSVSFQRRAFGRGVFLR